MLTFSGIHKSYTNYDSYTFKQIEVLMNKPIHLGFTISELSKLIKYETYYDKLQPFFKHEKKKLQYMDTDSFVLKVNTKDIIKDIKNHKDLFDFSNLNENLDLSKNKKKEVIGKFKI